VTGTQNQVAVSSRTFQSPMADHQSALWSCWAHPLQVKKLPNRRCCLCTCVQHLQTLSLQLEGMVVGGPAGAAPGGLSSHCFAFYHCHLCPRDPMGQPLPIFFGGGREGWRGSRMLGTH
jgi:hypothetical protein